MMPITMPCKCSNRVPLTVQTDNYRVRATVMGCHLRSFAKLIHLNFSHFLHMEPQFYWNNCSCNEYDALTRRHLLGHIPGYTPGNPVMKMLETNLIVMSSSMKEFAEVSHKVLLDNTRSAMKKRYKRAAYLLKDRVVNISEKEARSKTFVKYEKIPLGKYEAGKPPRLIQFRDFTYVYSLKKQVLGHSLQIKKDNTIVWFYEQKANTVFTKLYDSYGIAQVLRDSWDSFSSPVAICLDHSKFDGHYCEELLKNEHSYWLRLNPSEKLRHLLRYQYINKGVTSNGIKYKVKGTRLSGEFTTSEGNTVLNYAMLATWCLSSSIKRARIHANGDDSVVIMEHDELKKLSSLDFFRNFNMETEQDRIAYDFREISFCQAQPLRVLKDGKLVWYMVKEPARSLSRIQYSDSRYAKIATRYLAGVGLCELAVSSGIPISQAMACWLISLNEKPLASVDKFPARTSGNHSEPKSIHQQTRVDYEYAFGISTHAQLFLEYVFAGVLRSTQDPTLTHNLKKYKTFAFK